MISVLSPTANAIYYTANGIVPITWDLGALSSSVTGIDIDYSLDSGDTWSLITSITGTKTDLGLTSITEDFAGNVYNEDNWTNNLAVSSITGEELNVRGGPYGADYYGSNALKIRHPSSTASNMTISGSLWYSGTGSGSDSTTLSIWQDGNNHVNIVATWLYGNNIIINGRINGWWFGGSPNNGIDTGLDWATKRWYQIDFNRAGQSIDFYYKTSTTASWVAITSITANLTSNLYSGVGSKKFNANSGRWGHVDDIGVLYSPTGEPTSIGITGHNWMPYDGVTSHNTALIRISDDNDASASGVNSLFSILIPSENPIPLSDYDSVFGGRSILNNANLNTYAKDIVYNKQFIELRQINVLPTVASMTSVSEYTVTAEDTDWTSQYYGITTFPYSVLVLPEVYDNIIQGFTQISLSTVSASTLFLSNFDDTYVMNKFRDRTVRIARLFDTSTSVTSSITAQIEESATANFIDYQNGVIIIRTEGVTAQAINYSSGVQVTDNQFICIAKANEFNKTTNPSAVGLTGTEPLTSFEVPYVTGLGIYDDNANLLAIAKLYGPIKKSNKIDIIFKVQIDF